MRLQFTKALCTSTAVHGAALAAAIGIWALPRVAAQGRTERRDQRIEVARVEREAASPAPRPEPLEPLAEPDRPEPPPETLELLPPVEPLPEPTFARPELAPAPIERLLRPFEPPLPEPEPAPPIEPPPAPVEAPAPEPPARPLAGDPDPIEARPVPLDCPAPRYPALAETLGLEGVVRCWLLVAADGTVSSVRVEGSSGHALLDRAAQRALQGWRFEPATRDGQPVAMEIPWDVAFEG